MCLEIGVQAIKTIEDHGGMVVGNRRGVEDGIQNCQIRMRNEFENALALSPSDPRRREHRCSPTQRGRSAERGTARDV
jgi:hypothetical protein